jgi:hypothetical protein
MGIEGSDDFISKFVNESPTRLDCRIVLGGWRSVEPIGLAAKIHIVTHYKRTHSGVCGFLCCSSSMHFYEPEPRTAYAVDSVDCEDLLLPAFDLLQCRMNAHGPAQA